MHQKKAAILANRENMQKEREVKQNLAKSKLSAKYQVESKLFVETKAVVEKKREKFDPKRDDGKEAITFGGRLPMGPSIRQQAAWRAGV